MRVLIIGGSKFIGLHTTRELVGRGHQVTIVNRGLTKSSIPIPESVERIAADLRNRKEFIQRLGRCRWEVAMDFILQSTDLPDFIDYFNGNVRQYIHCSSCGVYVPMGRVPARETDPPGNVKGLTFLEKLAQERVCLEAHTGRGFPTTIIRPTLVNGAGLISLDAWGGRDIRFFKRLKRGEPVTVLNDGRALVQPVSVRDLAWLFATAAEQPRAVGQVYNGTSAQAVTLTEYARLLIEVFGGGSPIDYAPVEELIARHGATGKINAAGARFLVEHAASDIHKAEAELDYHPAVDARGTLEDSRQWMEENGLLAEG